MRKKTKGQKRMFSVRRVIGDPLIYYKKHYRGLTRGELREKDASLYTQLWRDGLLNHVPTARRFLVDPLNYYKKHYPRLTRGELVKRDARLYGQLWRDGLLNHVPTTLRLIVDPLKYYKKHYQGLTRGELRHKDGSLYIRLQKEGLIKHIPTANLSALAKKRSKFGLDALAYYKKHYVRLTRGELIKKDGSLYTRLQKEGLIKHIPTANLSALAKKRSKFGLDALAYYKKHYRGLTRGALQEKNVSLYTRLWKDGLLNHVPTVCRFIDDPLEYYRKHYAGLTRGEVWRKNKKLYNKLWLDGTLKLVPQRYK